MRYGGQYLLIASLVTCNVGVGAITSTTAEKREHYHKGPETKNISSSSSSNDGAATNAGIMAEGVSSH